MFLCDFEMYVAWVDCSSFDVIATTLCCAVLATWLVGSEQMPYGLLQISLMVENLKGCLTGYSNWIRINAAGLISLAIQFHFNKPKCLMKIWNSFNLHNVILLNVLFKLNDANERKWTFSGKYNVYVCLPEQILFRFRIFTHCHFIVMLSHDWNFKIKWI